MKKQIIKRAFSKLKRELADSPAGLAFFRARNRGQKQFCCPICGYYGPFASFHPPSGTRRNALCPKCKSLERHRLQFLIMGELEKNHDFSGLSVLHFAPEPFFKEYFQRNFQSYVSCDLLSRHVDFRSDMVRLAVEDARFDLVFASHVLEHILEDHLAVKEIHRVLKPGGLAVLAVPVIAKLTKEYGEPNFQEEGHVRAPGMDYYSRFSRYFSRTKIYGSGDFPETHGLHVYEDRTRWPPAMAQRPHMEGECHQDAAAVYYK